MKNSNRFHIILVLVFGLASINANAALVDRGGGLIYDTDLNVTWLQNANVNGLMTWSQATTWASNLSYYDSVRNVTYTDWRLPTVNPINGNTFNYSFSYNGSTDVGYNVSEQGTAYAGGTGSEMAHLFYNSLNDKGYCDPATSTASSCVGPQAGWGLTNTGPFTNLQSTNYWSGTEYAPNTNYAWFFRLNDGGQYSNGTGNSTSMYALAVRPGDVATVPIPAAFWLFGSGLIGLFGFMRKR
jgi:hypothetical protein